MAHHQYMNARGRGMPEEWRRAVKLDANTWRDHDHSAKSNSAEEEEYNPTKLKSRLFSTIGTNWSPKLTKLNKE